MPSQADSGRAKPRAGSGPGRVRAGLLALAALALSGSRCDRILAPPPLRTSEVLRAFGRPAATPAPAARVHGTPLNLYVDASGSMRGFVSEADSVYGQALDFLLDHASTAGYDLRIYGFSSRPVPAGEVGFSSILSPDFYSGTETSFPSLFRHLAQQQASGAVSAIVTDLVQSARESDQRELARAFGELAAPTEVTLLGFRSSFKGRYFVEGHRAGTVLHLDLSGHGPEPSRPFYLILVAPSRSHLEQARNLLLPDVLGHEEFDASSPGLPIERIEFVPPGPEALQIWNVFRPPEALARGLLTPRTLLSFIELTAPLQEQSPLRLRLELAAQPGGKPAAAMRSVRSLEFEIERRVVQAGKWRRAKVPDLAPEALFGSDGASLDVSYSFPRPAPLSWDVYRVRIAPGAGNLHLPPWVEEWSVLDDSLEMWGNRTLKLDLFAETLTRSIRERVAFSEHYILLGRGE